MQRYYLLLAIISAFTLFSPGTAHSLTADQFTAICKSAAVECDEHPVLQAYVGGALDLVAALQEDTDYMKNIVCRAPLEVYNVSNIILFIEKHSEQYTSKNTMLLVVRYLEENGGC